MFKHLKYVNEINSVECLLYVLYWKMLNIIGVWDDHVRLKYASLNVTRSNSIWIMLPFSSKFPYTHVIIEMWFCLSSLLISIDGMHSSEKNISIEAHTWFDAFESISFTALSASVRAYMKLVHTNSPAEKFVSF